MIIEYIQNAPYYSPGMLAILIGVGFFVGFINTIAGMATALSYGLFMAMGLPINIANGTTRVGVLAQFAVTSFIFKKKGFLNISTAAKVGIPVGLGSLSGAQLAATLNPNVIETIMGILLPIMAILLFIKPKTSKIEETLEKQKMNWWKAIIFFFIGVYGGFTHAGVGLLIIFGSCFMLGLDMIKSNAIKQFAVLIYTPIALFVFIYHGQVNWPIALIYSIGNIAGGIAGSYASIKGGENFIKVSVATVIFIMSFWLLYKNI
jgi:Predicted permeases